MSPRSDRSRSPREDRRRNRSRTPLNGSSRYDESGDRSHGASKDTQQERRVYVGNLSYEIKWPQLKDYMRTGISIPGSGSLLIAGEVVHAEVLTLPNGMSKVSIQSFIFLCVFGNLADVGPPGFCRDAGMLPNSSYLTNISIVEYSNRDEAQHAIATLSNSTFMGRQVFVREV